MLREAPRGRSVVRQRPLGLGGTFGLAGAGIIAEVGGLKALFLVPAPVAVVAPMADHPMTDVERVGAIAPAGRLHAVPAVHVQLLARDEARTVGGEEHDRLGDVGGSAEPT
ncbi:hypothetical protein GCM10023175_24730 [Pseudonocardia xishanensis]|uniref:Uncharacterized protein n=1 Tax=Pseudonocardia xishanensis TaxID=630995 RepID=A0ABP8RR45_9PSEU